MEGVDVGESTQDATRVKVAGLWTWIPKSVISEGSIRRNSSKTGADSLIVQEWWAKSRGFC